MPTITLTWTNLGIDRNARLVLNKGETLGNLLACLYVNNWTPSVTTTLANLTECTDLGYARISLVGANWTGTTTGGVASYAYPSITFFFTGSPGPQTIYGLFLLDQSGNCSALALLTTPYVIPPSGGSVTFDITHNGQQC